MATAVPINTRAARARVQRERHRDASFATYLREIEAHPLLDAQQERTLGRALRAGAPASGCEGPTTHDALQARERLIVCNLRLVVAIAACYADQGLPLLDVVQAGNIGLIRAVDKYQPGRARFSTHAAWWIREACSRYVMAHASLIYLPRGVIERRKRIHRVTGAAQLDGVSLDVSETAEAAALTPQQVKKALAAQERVASLEATVTTSESETITLGDTLADEGSEPLDVRVARDDAADQLYRKMATVLSERERIVLGMRFGLGALEGKTYAYPAVAAAIGVNRETVRTIEQRAIEKLRESYDADEHPERLRQALLCFAAG